MRRTTRRSSSKYSPKNYGLQRHGLGLPESIKSNADDDYSGYVDSCSCGLDALEDEQTAGRCKQC